MALYYGKKLKDMDMIHFAKNRLDKEYHLHLEKKGVEVVKMLKGVEPQNKSVTRRKSLTSEKKEV
jgi:hypothetical protein